MVDPRVIDTDALADALGIDTGNGSTVFDDILPTYARVQVQIRDKGCIDRCADILIELGHSLRLLARRHDLKQGQVRHLVHGEVKAANSRMLAITKSGV